MDKWHSKHVPLIIQPHSPNPANSNSMQYDKEEWEGRKGMGMGRNMKEDDKEQMCLACPFKSKFSFSHIFSRTTHGQCTLALQIYEPPSPSMCYTSSAPTTTSPSQMHHHIHQNLTSTQQMTCYMFLAPSTITQHKP